MDKKIINNLKINKKSHIIFNNNWINMMKMISQVNLSLTKQINLKIIYMGRYQEYSSLTDLILAPQIIRNFFKKIFNMMNMVGESVNLHKNIIHKAKLICKIINLVIIRTLKI